MSTNSLRGLLGHRTGRSAAAVTVHSAAAKGMATLAVTAVAGLAVTGTGVYALLKAQAFNATPQTVSAGSLLLTLAAGGGGTPLSGGLTTAVANMAPGDTVNRFVEVKNTGTIAGTNLTLQLSDTGTANALTTDAVAGLQVTVTSCSQPWTLINGVGACGGTTGAALPLTSAVAAKAAPLVLNSGVVAPGGSNYYRVGVTLGPSTEISTNGVLPTGTVQNLTASLKWTFTLDQRAVTSLDS